jgi:hypothetical protein
MTYSIFSRLMIIACLSGLSVPAFADQAEQIRQECEEEVAGYGIEDPEQQQQAIEECIAMRTGADMESATTAPAE